MRTIFESKMEGQFYQIIMSSLIKCVWIETKLHLSDLLRFSFQLWILFQLDLTSHGPL